MKNAVGGLFKSKADRVQIEKPNPKKLEYKDNCRLSSNSEKTIDEFPACRLHDAAAQRIGVGSRTSADGR